MKRIYIAAGFMIVIILGSFFTLYQCKQFKDAATPELNQIIEDAKNGRLTQAAAAAQNFYNSWQETENTMVWYIAHETLEKITDISSRLPALAQYGDTAQLIAQTNQLINCVDELYDDELPRLRNLL